jgi:hypothetical protein
MAWLGLPLLAQPAAAASDTLPRFTEEREAAARFFVKKHLPELLPLLDELHNNNREQYVLQVRGIFQVTEMLADLMDEPRLYELELRIWKAENKAYTLVGKLASPSDQERRNIEQQMMSLARELVDLELQFLELKAERLDQELGEIKDEIALIRENLDRQIRDRYEGFLDQAKRRKKSD